MKQPCAAPVNMAIPEIWLENGAIARLGAACDTLSIACPAIVTTPRRRFLDRATEMMGRSARPLPFAQDHCPIELVERAERDVDSCDGVIALGGGAAIGLAKAIADRRDVPLVAIPTTFAGSALTDGYGVRHGRRKEVIRSSRARAAIVIVDPVLFRGFIGRAASASMMNAMAHTVEALAKAREPALVALAEAAIGGLHAALPCRDAAAAERAVAPSLSAARCLAAVGTGIHHRFCHVLGGRFDVPHAVLHAKMLPYSIALHEHGDDRFAAALRKALETDAPAAAVHRRLVQSGLGGGLQAERVGHDAIAALADLAAAGGHDRALALDCCERAWSGAPPR